MSMLAEPRSRQKWSHDPRNTRWANDKSKFGYQLMTKMGWSEGKGLGQKESGTTSHIKVSKRRSNAGIGTKRSHDDDWIAHQNDFNDLLNSLNQGIPGSESGTKIKSLEDRVKMSKKKILYTKFVKSKDLSNASSHDLACIFGKRSKSAPATPQMSDEEGNDSDISAASCPVTDNHIKKSSTEHGFTTIRTGVSVTDYFTQKMAALANARECNSTVEKSQVIEVSEEVEEKVEKVKKKKNKKSKDVVKIESESESDVELVSEITKNVIQIDNDSENEAVIISEKKKKKKKRKNTENENKSSSGSEEMENEAIITCEKNKRKKGRNTENENKSASVSEEIENEVVIICDKKKKKKVKKTENESKSSSESEYIEFISKKNNEVEIIEDSKDSDCSDNIKKKKKKKKRKVENDEDDDVIITKKRTKYTEDNVHENTETTSEKKSKKKKKLNIEEETECVEIESEDDSKTKEKKKKKKSKK